MIAYIAYLFIRKDYLSVSLLNNLEKCELQKKTIRLFMVQSTLAFLLQLSNAGIKSDCMQRVSTAGTKCDCTHQM